MSDVAWDIFPFWLRGWGWWTLTGVLHEFDKILSHPTPCVLEVLLAIVEVTERGISETRQDEQSPNEFSLLSVNTFPKKQVTRIKKIINVRFQRSIKNNKRKLFIPMDIILATHSTVNCAVHSGISNLIRKTNSVCNY